MQLLQNRSKAQVRIVRGQIAVSRVARIEAQLLIKMKMSILVAYKPRSTS